MTSPRPSPKEREFLVFDYLIFISLPRRSSPSPLERAGERCKTTMAKNPQVLRHVKS